MNDINTSLKMAIQIIVMCFVVFIIVTLTMVATSFGRSVASGYTHALDQSKITALYSLEDCAKAVPASTVYKVLKESDIVPQIEVFAVGDVVGRCVTIEGLKDLFAWKYFVDIEEDAQGNFYVRMVGSE